jgi:hypothetical protein
MHFNQHRPTKNKQGSALVASLLIVMLVAGMGAGLVQVQSSIMRRQLASTDRTRALYVAEAGLAESFLAISQGKTGNVGTSDDLALYDNGLFWVEANKQPNGDIELVSTGLVGSGRFALSVVVTPPTSPIGTLGFFASESLMIFEESVIDGFDSAVGKFQDQVIANDMTSGGARIRSNGDINIHGSLTAPDSRSGARPGGGSGAVAAVADTETYIMGDVIPGPKGLVTMESGVTVTGKTTPSTRAAEVPEVLLPDLAGLGVVEPASPSSYNIGPGEVLLEAVQVPTGITASLVGPVTLVTKSLRLESLATLNFDATHGPITVYVLNDFTLKQDSKLGHVAGGADQISVFLDELSEANNSVAPTIDLSGGYGEFHGAIYAPASDIRVPSTIRIYGGLVAKNLVLEAGSRVTYDESLHSNVAGVASLPELKSWVVEDLPDLPICKTRKNPFKYVNEKGLMTRDSSVAHVEDSLRLTYQDTGGVTRIYAGDPKALDWTQVKVAYKVQWEDPDSAGTYMQETKVLNSIKTLPE